MRNIPLSLALYLHVQIIHNFIRVAGGLTDVFQVIAMISSVWNTDFR